MSEYHQQFLVSFQYRQQVLVSFHYHQQVVLSFQYHQQVLVWLQYQKGDAGWCGWRVIHGVHWEYRGALITSLQDASSPILGQCQQNISLLSCFSAGHPGQAGLRCCKSCLFIRIRMCVYVYECVCVNMFRWLANMPVCVYNSKFFFYFFTVEIRYSFKYRLNFKTRI